MPGNSDRPLSAALGEAMIPMRSMVCTADGGAGGARAKNPITRMRTTTDSVRASGNSGFLRSGAGTLTPFERPRIVSVRRFSFNLHDFHDLRTRENKTFNVYASQS